MKWCGVGVGMASNIITTVFFFISFALFFIFKLRLIGTLVSLTMCFEKWWKYLCLDLGCSLNVHGADRSKGKIKQISFPRFYKKVLTELRDDIKSIFIFSLYFKQKVKKNGWTFSLFHLNVVENLLNMIICPESVENA